MLRGVNLQQQASPWCDEVEGSTERSTSPPLPLTEGVLWAPCAALCLMALAEWCEHMVLLPVGPTEQTTRKSGDSNTKKEKKTSPYFIKLLYFSKPALNAKSLHPRDPNSTWKHSLVQPILQLPTSKRKKKKCFILRVITRGSLSGALSLHPTRQPIITTHQTGCERGIIRLNSLREHIQHTQ